MPHSRRKFNQKIGNVTFVMSVENHYVVIVAIYVKVAFVVSGNQPHGEMK
jgi:hypothetical protein